MISPLILPTHLPRYGTFCSGIEAVSAAWVGLGWHPVFFSEIEPFPCAVLAQRYPHVPNLGDMMLVDGTKLCGLVDVLVAGTPCQSFSIAGLRKGLADDRGNLTLELVRLLNESKTAHLVWENVPGVFTDKGNAFGCFLGALSGENAPLEPPGGKWADVGYVLGPQRIICWRVLDAQYFGLAQRRERVFLVASLREGADPREILFEYGGRRRDTPPRRKAPEDVAGCLKSRARKTGAENSAEAAASGYLQVVGAITANCYSGGSGGRPEGASAGHYIPEIVPPMTAKWSRGVSGPAGDEFHNLVAEVSPTMRAGANRTGGDRPMGMDVDTCESLVVVAPIAPPLTHKPYGDNASREDALVPMAFHGSQDPDVSGDVTHPLGRNQGQETCVLAFTERSRKEGRTLEAQSDLSYALTNPGSGGRSHSRQIMDQEMRVRRLTPLECERLQGFPDDYTALKDYSTWRDVDESESPEALKAAGYKVRQTKKGKWRVNDPDGPRYRALGNAMPVPVMRWIGARLKNALEARA